MVLGGWERMLREKPISTGLLSKKGGKRGEPTGGTEQGWSRRQLAADGRGASGGRAGPRPAERGLGTSPARQRPARG